MGDLWLDRCPHCRQALPAAFLYWTCPVCRHEMGAITPLNNCDWCYFSPRLFPCPSCSKLFAPFPLKDPGWEILPGEAAAHVDLELRPLDGVPFSWTEEAVAALGQAPETFRNQITALRVPVPKRVAKVTLHTVHEDPQGMLWAHFWVHAQPPPAVLAEDPWFQVAVCVQAGLGGPECSVRIIDALIPHGPGTRRSEENFRRGQAQAGGGSSIRITLRDVEPFNVPPVPDKEAAEFMRRLTGSEAFDVPTGTRPRSMMIDDLIWNPGGSSVAQGWLLTIGYDSLQELAKRYTTMEDLLKEHAVGRIRIELGASRDKVKISCMPTGR